MTNYTTEKMKLYMREKRKQRKAEGLCVTCGSYIARQGRTDCEKCAERKQRNFQERKVKRKGLDND
jgi:hypothetical protein